MEFSNFSRFDRDTEDDNYQYIDDKNVNVRSGDRRDKEIDAERREKM